MPEVCTKIDQQFNLCPNNEQHTHLQLYPPQTIITNNTRYT